MVSYAFALDMSIEMLQSPLFVSDCRLGIFSSALEYKHKTGYKPEIKSIKQQKLHSDDDGSYVRFVQ